MNKLCKKVQIVLLMVATVALQMQAGAPPSRGKKRTRTTRMQSPRTIQKEVTKAAGTAGKASSELDLIVVELSNIIDIVVNKKRSTTTTVSDLANSKKEANRLMRNLDSKVANLIRDDFNTIVKLALKSSDENKANAKESFDSILE